MIFIGIDIGFSGAIAVLDESKIIDAIDMPVLKAGKRTEINELHIRDLLASYKHIEDKIAVFIEKAQSMPGQGIASTGRYLMSYGQIRGICAGIGVGYTLVHPKTWKSAMMKDMPKEKQASIIRCQQLFPNFPLPQRKDHGRADAILIAAYGRKMQYLL
jgi:hypothetical protein